MDTTSDITFFFERAEKLNKIDNSEKIKKYPKLISYIKHVDKDLYYPETTNTELESLAHGIVINIANCNPWFEGGKQTEDDILWEEELTKLLYKVLNDKRFTTQDNVRRRIRVHC